MQWWWPLVDVILGDRIKFGIPARLFIKHMIMKLALMDCKGTKKDFQVRMTYYVEDHKHYIHKKQKFPNVVYKILLPGWPKWTHCGGILMHIRVLLVLCTPVLLCWLIDFDVPLQCPVCIFHFLPENWLKCAIPLSQTLHMN